MRNSFFAALVALLLHGSMFNNAAVAQSTASDPADAEANKSVEEYGGFLWPVPAVHTGAWDIMQYGILGSLATVPYKVREDIISKDYTAEERRNIQIVLDMSTNMIRNGDSLDFRHFPSMRPSEDETETPRKEFSVPHSGFYVLHGAFGWPENNGYAAYSFQRVINETQIIAHGNRVIELRHAIGGLSGPMFGFKANGQMLENREAHLLTFHLDGSLKVMEPWTGEDLGFYQQLGGELKFSQDSRDIDRAREILTGQSISLAQPAPDAAAKLQQTLKNQDYELDEMRNIRTLEAVLATPGGFDEPGGENFAAEYHNLETTFSPYKTLASINNVPAKLQLSSIKDLKRDLVDVVASGNRVWGHILTSGEQVGPLFGAEPTGLPLRWNEHIYLTFDANGRILESERYPVQGEIYLALGGTFKFPYADVWYCPGCPPEPATLLTR